MKDGKKVLVLPQNVLQAHQKRQKQLMEQKLGVSSPSGVKVSLTFNCNET